MADTPLLLLPECSLINLEVRHEKGYLHGGMSHENAIGGLPSWRKES